MNNKTPADAEETSPHPFSLEKAFYKSRTIILNAAAMAPIIVPMIMNDPTLSGLLSPQVIGWFYTGVAVINIYLRTKGGAPLTIKKPVPQSQPLPPV